MPLNLVAMATVTKMFFKVTDNAFSVVDLGSYDLIPELLELSEYR